MSKNTHQTLLFKDFFRKKIEADFAISETSSDGGLLVIREVESSLGLIQRIVDTIHDKRHPSYVKHQTAELLKQRVFQIIAGYEDANDCSFLRADPILKIACESKESLASQPTMTRFENSPGAKTLYRMGQVLVEAFIKSYLKRPKAIILDIDDTGDLTYGNQQLSLFNTYHGGYCYMPIHIYEGTSGKIITTILRPGKRPSGKEIVSILKRIVKRLRRAWGKKVKILLRGDGHYSNPEVYDFCNANSIKFIFGFKAYSTVLEKATQLQDNAKELYQLRNKPIKLYDVFDYQAASWSQPRRVIVKAEYNSQGSNTRFIVTNLKLNKIRFLYETVYCGRGNMELMIKEHKNHLSSGRTSCTGFAANQFRLFLHSMAYILLHTLRERYLSGTGFANSQFDTIRLRLIKIGTQVSNLKTKIKVHFPLSCPVQDDFYSIMRKINILYG